MRISVKFALFSEITSENTPYRVWEVAGRGGCRASLEKVAVAPWVGSRLCVCRSASPGGAGPLTELDVAYGASQVLLGHYLADDHQQVELAVEEAMRQAGRS